MSVNRPHIFYVLGNIIPAGDGAVFNILVEGNHQAVVYVGQIQLVSQSDKVRCRFCRDLRWKIVPEISVCRVRLEFHLNADGFLHSNGSSFMFLITPYAHANRYHLTAGLLRFPAALRRSTLSAAACAGAPVLRAASRCPYHSRR